MSGTVGKAYIEIRGDTSKLSGDMQGASAQLDKFASAAKGIIAGYLSYSAIKGFMDGMIGIADSTAEAVDAMGDFAEVSGMTINQVSKLQYVVEASGQSWSAVQGSIFRFSKALGGVSEEGSDTAKVFAQLGVATKGMDGQLRPVESVLLDVADKFQRMTSASEKTKIAFELFGRGCYEIIPILNMGSQGIKALQQEAERLGLALTAENVAAVQGYFRTRQQFESMIGKIKLQLGTELMPILGQLGTELQGALLGPDGKLLPEVKDGLTSLVNTFRTLGQTVLSVAPQIVTAMSSVAQVVNFVVGGTVRLGQALADLWSVIMQWELPDWWSYDPDKEAAAQKYIGMGAAAEGIRRGAQAKGEIVSGFKWGMVNDVVAATWSAATLKPLEKIKSGAGEAKAAVEELQDVTVPAFTEMAHSMSPLLGYVAQLVARIQEGRKQAEEALALKAAQGYMVSSNIDWAAIEAIPERTQSQLQGLGENGSLFPSVQLWEDEEAFATFRDQADYLGEFVSGGIFGSLGEQLAAALDSMRPEDFSEKFDQIMAITQAFAENLAAASEFIGTTLGNFVSDAAMGGFRNAMGKLVAVMCQYLGKKLMMMGTSMIVEGQGLIAMGMNPLNPMAPLFLAAGKQHMVKGAILVGAGAALMAGSGLIGNMVGGGGGSSSSSGSSSTSGSSSYSNAAGTAEGYTYNLTSGQGGTAQGRMGAQPVSITINAMDSQSFSDYLARNGSEAVTTIMERSYQSNGSARNMQRWG